MKLIHEEANKGIVTLKLTSSEDAYHLLKLIAPGDQVQGRTERKIRLGDAEEKGAVIKKTVWIEIKAEKAEIDGASIRVNGTVMGETGDIPKGSHQSISLEIGDEMRLAKLSWGVGDRKRLEMALSEEPSNIIAVVFDREEALFAKLTREGFRIYLREQGDVARKEYAAQGERKTGFFSSLAATIAAQDLSLKPQRIILASPAFWKEYLLKELSKETARKCALATVSSCDDTSFNELLRRPELESVLAQDRATNDERGIESAMLSLRQGLACYGVGAVEQAAADGNLAHVYVSESALNPRESGVETKERLERLLSSAEAVGSAISIITNERSQARLKAFSGVIGIMRWKTSE